MGLLEVDVYPKSITERNKGRASFGATFFEFCHCESQTADMVSKGGWSIIDNQLNDFIASFFGNFTFVVNNVSRQFIIRAMSDKKLIEVGFCLS
jgi:hypothetical protein